MSDLRVNTISASDGTSPVTLTKQSAAKAWNRFVPANVPTLIDSFNNSTALDNDTGDFTFSFINNMSNGHYAPHCGGGQATVGDNQNTRTQIPDQITTSSFVFNMLSSDTDGDGNYLDDGNGYTTVFGDLA